jgi:guanine deaminase
MEENGGRQLAKSIPSGEPYEGVRPVDSEPADPAFAGIEAAPNRWVELACEEAKASVEVGGGPFGAILVQVDDETGRAIRYWRDSNHVVELSDPTAHAEISVIRSACGELGVFRLDRIARDGSRLPQEGPTSHCEIYSSCEPCPMCYSAIAWARIPVLVFAATRFEASAPEVVFRDEAMHRELCKPYGERSVRVYHASSPCSAEAFDLWRRSGNRSY